MADTETLSQKLIEEFAENYMEKLFYFCLKKTGNSYEAEDLVSDIALNVLTSLKCGIIPKSFSAWVWQIARNRYSVWAEKKRKNSESNAGMDIGEYELEDESTDLIDEIIHSEDLSVLRRELSFISSDYREVVVAYYIDDRKVKDIAQSLSLPEGTVMSKLHRARKILKDGMSMAREFGTMSYKPENIGFIMNGISSSEGEPWRYLRRLLCKNILLAAYRNPSTAEELAIETGVALPYMEEEIADLVDATLLKENGSKYETNFFIISADTREKVNAHRKGITPELTKAITDALEFEVKWKNENCPEWNEGYQSYEDMKWALLMYEVDTLSFKVFDAYDREYKLTNDTKNLGKWGHTLRPRGGEWDIIGLEEYSGGEPDFISLYGCVTEPNDKEREYIHFNQYIYNYHGIRDSQPPQINYTDGLALVDIAKGRADEVDSAVLSRLAEYGYIKETPNGFKPTFLVMFKDKNKNMPPEVEAEYNSLVKKAVDIALRHCIFCCELVYKEIPAFLKDDAHQIRQACANIFSLRGAVLEEAIRTGYLSYSGSPVIGAYLTV